MYQHKQLVSWSKPEMLMFVQNNCSCHSIISWKLFKRYFFLRSAHDRDSFFVGAEEKEKICSLSFAILAKFMFFYTLSCIFILKRGLLALPESKLCNYSISWAPVDIYSALYIGVLSSLQIETRANRKFVETFRNSNYLYFTFRLILKFFLLISFGFYAIKWLDRLYDSELRHSLRSHRRKVDT